MYWISSHSWRLFLFHTSMSSDTSPLCIIYALLMRFRSLSEYNCEWLLNNFTVPNSEITIQSANRLLLVISDSLICCYSSIRLANVRKPRRKICDVKIWQIHSLTSRGGIMRFSTVKFILKAPRITVNRCKSMK